MRYKHIATVGSVLIVIFVLLAALMYYFNQDRCPVGTFPCKNSTLCVPQRNWCNNEMDCPENDDESECYDWHGYREWMKDKPFNDLAEVHCPNVSEGDAGYYDNCEYEFECKVYCTKFLKEIPQKFFENIMHIDIKNTSLPILRRRYFQRYHRLRVIDLQFDEIQRLEHGVFDTTPEIVFLILSNNKLEEITQGHLKNLKYLSVLQATNNQLRTIDLTDLENNTHFKTLTLDKNLLTSSNITFPFLPNLRELDLDENILEAITDDMFSNTPKLASLAMESNRIKFISQNAFKNLEELQDLNLKNNKIVTIPPNLFASQKNLSLLWLGYNQIENLPPDTFIPLRYSLESLGVEEIEMDNMDVNLFNLFDKLDFVYFRKFHYCTAYAPKVKNCRPVSDGVSSLSHLLGKRLLRASVWGIACITCVGNALVLWGRFTAKDENRVLSIIIRNLAVSDLLMGFYLLTIGFEDMHFRNNYTQQANAWMSSWNCTLIGMLAMTSSEVSVLILSFMSVERFMLIAAPLKGHRTITPQTAAAAMIVVWVIGVTLALIPAIHWRSSTRFYGLNGMCFPLHIDDPFLIGWEYSAFIFLGVNLLGLLTIGYVYAGMFVSIWRTRHATPLSVRDSEFVLRFFLIVLTDAVCWAPIIILKIMALAEYPVSPDLHAWVVVFILPVNSAVNPLLYTFTTPKFRERLSEGWLGKVFNVVISRRQSRSGSQTSCSDNNRNFTLTTPSIVAEKLSKKSVNESLIIDILSKNNQI